MGQYRPLARGAQPGELYLSSYWATRENADTEGVLFSDDHGQTLQFQSDFKRWTLIGDYSQGCVLGLVGAVNQYQISHDYGVTWDSTVHSFDGFIFRGSEPAELYNFYTDFGGVAPVCYVKRSSDNGITYSTPLAVPDFYLMASGSEPGHVYGYKDYTIWHSADYGQSFEQFSIDSSQILYYSCHTNIVPGIVAGEVYMVSFEQGIRFHVYRSTNYGQEFTHMFQSDSINPLDINNLYFFSGLQEGEFYWVYEKPENEPFYHSDLYINYSTDYGSTYQGFYHDLSQYTYGTADQLTNLGVLISYGPNPFKDNLQVQVNFSKKRDYTIELYDIYGERIINSSNKDVKSETDLICIDDLQNLKSGVYLLKVKVDGQDEIVKKVLKMN
jgi:hypothetical protein